MLAVRRTLVAVGALVAIGVVVVAVLAFLTFGVRSSGPSAAPSSDVGVIAASMVSPDAPAAFRDRTAFRSCGRIVLTQGRQIPPARIRCLASTPAEGRELVVEASTTEGDPIVRYYRTGPGLDGVDIFEDATRDRFGGGWHHSLCRSGRIDQTGACA
jgi:hypothetical protein